MIIAEPEPVVRGKARKQLRGWCCQQCKNVSIIQIIQYVTRFMCVILGRPESNVVSV